MQSWTFATQGLCNAGLCMLILLQCRTFAGHGKPDFHKALSSHPKSVFTWKQKESTPTPTFVGQKCVFTLTWDRDGRVSSPDIPDIPGLPGSPPRRGARPLYCHKVCPRGGERSLTSREVCPGVGSVHCRPFRPPRAVVRVGGMILKVGGMIVMVKSHPCQCREGFDRTSSR